MLPDWLTGAVRIAAFAVILAGCGAPAGTPVDSREPALADAEVSLPWRLAAERKSSLMLWTYDGGCRRFARFIVDESVEDEIFVAAVYRVPPELKANPDDRPEGDPPVGCPLIGFPARQVEAQLARPRGARRIVHAPTFDGPQAGTIGVGEMGGCPETAKPSECPEE